MEKKEMSSSNIPPPDVAPFPQWLSLTVTNSCNLHCRMCGQWGVEGYLNHNDSDLKELPVDTWLKMVEDIPPDQYPLILVRGGEPFRYSGVFELLQAFNRRNFFVTIDTNGTLLERYAREILQSGVNNLTVSVDGPAEVHDQVRGVKGTFKKIKAGVKAIYREREDQNKEITLGLNCTISDTNFHSLGQLPDAARELNIPSISTVPYYYFNRSVGKAYEDFMQNRLNSRANTWKGFFRETSGVKVDVLHEQIRKLNQELGEIHLLQFMPLSESDLATWFSDCTTEVGDFRCRMPWKLLDIQPNGDVNFCIDFPDYIVGNIAEQPLADIWHSDRAERFRKVLSEELLPICTRCGAKYMSKI